MSRSFVEIVHWNPRSRHLPRPLGRIRYGARTNNFGDLLGPLIVNKIVGDALADVSTTELPRSTRRRLLSVGSIMHFARDYDVVWGSGVNGKIPAEQLRFRELDVRAVRGPMTRGVLEKRGIAVPPVYGDPALLVPHLFPEWELRAGGPKRELAYLPNLHDIPQWQSQDGFISPIGPPENVVQEILRSERVITSSLHGLIVAEVYGIPVVLVKPGREDEFKYLDYARGTGRESLPIANSVAEARSRIGSNGGRTPLEFDGNALISAFPTELWDT